MAEVHQIYITHCTHGSSALERREGELASRMLGYSARAGSLHAAELRRCYRHIERYVYYYLPRDTPAEDKLSLTASSAPRRLIFHPSAGGVQLVGQVCYRPTDTQGRPGSYFAHVLWQPCDDKAQGWSAADCLRLWNARGWAQEDHVDIPFLLPSLTSAEELLAGQRPAIDDRVLRSFLTADGTLPLDDPGRVIPARWRNASLAQRRQIVQQVLEAVLQQGIQGRQGVLLLAEAELAALLLYAATRLLPRCALSADLSFSTFEPNPDRLCTLLAATQSHDPRTADLRAESYRGSGPAVVNTFVPRQENGPECTAYARGVLQRLLDEGWEAVDLALTHLARCGPRSLDDLNRAAHADRGVPLLLAGSRPSGDDWRRTFAAEYLGHAVRHHLARLAHDSNALQRLAGTPAQVPLLELAGTQSDPECRPAVLSLLKNLPDGWVDEICRLNQVARDDKLTLLLRYVTAHGELPPASEWIWEPARSGKALLPELLGRLEPSGLQRLFHHVAASHGAAFVLALLAACRHQRSRLPALSHVIRSMEDDHLVGLLLEHGEILQGYPAEEPALSQRLQKLLLGLPLPPARFAQRLTLILQAGPLVGDERLQQIARHWEVCRQQVVTVGRLQPVSSFARRRPWPQIEDAFRRAAESLNAALPEERVEDGRLDALKLQHLRQLGVALLGGEGLLPPGPWRHAALWEKARRYFTHGYWPADTLARLRPASSQRRARLLAAAILVIPLVALLGWSLWREAADDVPVTENPKLAPQASLVLPATPAAAPSLPVTAPAEVSAVEAGKGNAASGTVMGTERTEASGPPSAIPTESGAADLPAPAPVPANVVRDPDAAAPSPASATPAADRQIGLSRTASGLLDLHYVIDASPSSLGVDAATKALLTVMLRGPSGQIIKPNSVETEGFRAVWRVRQELAAGTVNSETVSGVSQFDPVRLRKDVQTVWFHLEFFASEPGLPTDHPPSLAKTAPKYLEPESGYSYRITYSITEEQLRSLRSRQPLSGPREF